MEDKDIISVSSGSDDDSDIILVGSYEEAKDDAVPFIREEWLPVTPVLIDITDQKLVPSIRKGPKRETISSIVIDLRDVCPSDDVDVQLDSSQALPSIHTIDKHVRYSLHPITTSFGKQQSESQSNNTGKDVTSSECFVESNVQYANGRTENLLHVDSNCNSTEQLSWDTSFEHCRFNSTSNTKSFKSLSEVLKDSDADVMQNTKDTRLTSPTGYSVKTDQEKEENIDPSQIQDYGLRSPYSLDSPYYCPSEIDAVLFSDDESNNDPLLTTWHSQQSPQISELESHTGLQSNTISSTEEGPTVNTGENKNVNQMSVTQIPHSPPSTPTSLGVSPPYSPEPGPKQNQCSKPNSPTSTEILASDTAAHSPGLSMVSSPSGTISFPCSLPSSPALSDRTELRSGLDVMSLESSPTRLGQTSSGEEHEDLPDNVESDSSEDNTQYICLAQLRKLRQCVVGAVSRMLEDGEEEDFGSPEPLCRQSLSLVYSTIEENYPEGTLQLLSDFIQPRYYPPVGITRHLLREIFLDPQSPYVLAIEAYNLLMKIQRYHPADTATIPWDWDLLSSVMEEKDNTRRLRTEVRCMLLQYVLQVLEDDFQFKLTNQRLQDSVAKAMLSCDQRFRNVKDIINWIMNAVKESVHHSKDVDYPKRTSNNCLKIVLSLQRMLTLALEVDRAPIRNSNKLSQELFQNLNTMSPCRQIRLLLLSTLESKLLRCELLEILLDDACSQKSTLPVSLSMLLHYLQTSTLPSDFSDGEERWRKWDELLQLLWMLMLSYEEVVTGHLRYPITDRFNETRSPLWMANDQVKRSAVQRAAEVFLSRAMKDIGHDVPMEMKESLCQLKDHITDVQCYLD